MKKFLVILFAMVIGVVAMQAQLPRTVMGIRLGQTTEAQAKTILKNQGLTYKGIENGCQSYRNGTWGGYSWQIVALKFRGGKVAEISLMGMPDHNKYNNVRASLIRTYGGRHPYQDHSYKTMFQIVDTNTSIVLGLQDIICLMFIDNNNR